MKDISQRISALTPEQRALFEARLRQKGLQAPERQAIPRRPPELAHVCPASVDQERLWFIEQLQPGNTAYNIFTASRIRGPLDADVMGQVVDELVRRHEVLRTTFADREGLPVQVIAPELKIPLKPVDLTHLPEGEREAEALRLVTEDFSAPFDLARGPLVRVRLLRTGEGDHVLSVNMHHSVTDRWSAVVFEQELLVLYQAFSQGRPSPLPELPIQYADFAVWQRERMESEVYRRQLDYWKQKLGGAPPVLELPSDRPRPAIQTFRGSRVYLRMPRRLLDALRELSQREGATMYMTLMAAYKALLSRYTGQEDLLVGCSIANRDRPETQNLVGFFLNLLVLRTDLSGNPTFRELVGRERETALGAYANTEVPFGKLVQELRPRQDASRNPVVQVAFIYLDFPESKVMEFLGMTAEHLDIDNGASRFDLTLALTETSEGYEGSIEYLTDLYDRPRMERMAKHLEVLLEAVAADPDVRLADLPLLTEGERRLLLTDWNDTRADYPSDLCAHELFEERARLRPEAPAVFFEGGQVSYGELNARANRLARRLRARGVTTDSKVGVCLNRSTEMIVAVLGVLKAGGAYVPLDPAYPRERLSFMAEDAGLSALVTDGALVENLPRLACPAVLLGAEAEASEEASAEDLPRLATPDSLAYVIYTSGSTGRPKGVMVEHRGLADRARAFCEQFGVGADDRQLQFLSLSFDASAQEIFPTLAAGAALVLGPDAREHSAREVLRAAERAGVTQWAMPAPYWRTLVDELSAAGEPLPDALRLLTIGGDAFPAEKLEAFRSLARHPVRLFNVYGPTEATVIATSYEVPRAHSEAGASAAEPSAKVPVGRPVRNVRVYVVDANLRPVPVGIHGELLVGGVGVARGYLNRPALTAERFVPDPFSAEPGARLYRTGDLARYLEDGSLEFLGRADEQVKVRGFRIEPGEIEAALAAHPSVGGAAVVAREDAPGDRRLVAYVTGVNAAADVKGASINGAADINGAGVDAATDGRSAAPGAEELRRHLRGLLPEHMIPSAFVALEEFPLTPSGKVNRRALPAPDAASAGARYVEPRTPTEEALAALYARTLGLGRAGACEHFFDAGGDSLLATQLVSQLRRTFGVDVPLRRLFEMPTVEALAAHVEELLIEQLEDLSEEEARQLLAEGR